MRNLAFSFGQSAWPEAGDRLGQGEELYANCMGDDVLYGSGHDARIFQTNCAGSKLKPEHRRNEPELQLTS